MLFQADDFEVEFDGVKVFIKVLEMAGRTVFKLDFSDDRPSLIISRSQVFNGGKVWMSIPEGRQGEAVPIGAKIVEHFKNLNTK